MRVAIRWLTAAALAGVCLTVWGADVSRNRLEAQSAGKPAVIKRIYTGTDGLSHVEDIPLNANTVLEKIASVETGDGQPGRFGVWHAAPQREYIINLSGSGHVQCAEGNGDLP